MLNVQCPFCDSSLVKMISLDEYMCNYCGRRFQNKISSKPLINFEV